MRLRSKRGHPLQAETPPFCSRQPEAISLLALRGKFRRATPPPTERPHPEGIHAVPGASAPRAIRLPQPPAPEFDDTPLPSSQRRRTPVAALNVALGLGVAIVVGLAIGHSRAFKLPMQNLANDSLQVASLPELPPSPTILPPPKMDALLDHGDTTAPAIASAPPAQTPKHIVRKKKKRRTVQMEATADNALSRKATKQVHSTRKKRAKPTPAPTRPSEPYPDEMPSYTAARVEPTTRAALTQCLRRDGLINQERCRWRICNHRWGKQGCPNYEQRGGQPLIGVVVSRIN
ncbi:MAG: hypothetical protein HYS18_08170 [Burkholderiales bacterium]|nr:hypothetical protein [Burkholderiales bacterium]